MYKDPTEWRRGFKRWKETGESPWKAGKRLPKFDMGTEGEPNYSDDVYKNMYFEDDDVSEYLRAIEGGAPEKIALNWVKRNVREYPNLYALKGPTLPEVVVKPNPNSMSTGLLTTYYPWSTDFPVTGHSTLELLHDDDNSSAFVTAYGDDPWYNFVTNNCSDATRKAIEYSTGKKINPLFFTTPGDVKDFVESELGGKSKYIGDGSVETTFSIPTKQARKIVEYSRMLNKKRFLPKFDTGTEGYKYTLAGKDFDEWWRITDDKMSKEFLDVVVRPKSRGGNTTEGNWRRLWSLKGEPGLKLVSPEFDALSLGITGKNLLDGVKFIGRKFKRGLAARANWQGDAVALTKERLANGGFDRLSKTYNSNITNEAVNLETANPLLIKNSNLPLVYSPERRATLLATDVHEVPSWYATGNPNHIGVSNAELGPVLYSDRPVQYMGRQASSDIAAHEYSHYVYTPNEKLSTEVFSPVEGYGRYFRKANSGEVQARGTQIKNYFGLKEGEPVTAEHLKYASKHFVKDRRYDNGMTEFFKSIKDFDAVAKWITKNSPQYAIPLTIGYGTYNKYAE